MSSCALWYKDGTFFDVETTHVNFFLNHPDLLGFTQEEKEALCVKNSLAADATFCPEPSEQRDNIVLEVLKRGAIRIRFYGGQTSVQCYDQELPCLIHVHICAAISSPGLRCLLLQGRRR